MNCSAAFSASDSPGIGSAVSLAVLFRFFVLAVVPLDSTDLMSVKILLASHAPPLSPSPFSAAGSSTTFASTSPSSAAGSLTTFASFTFGFAGLVFSASSLAGFPVHTCPFFGRPQCLHL